MDRELTFGRLFKRSFFLQFGAVFMLVGLPLLVFGVFAGLKEQRYAEQGAETDGVVVSKDVRRGKGTSYRVSYVFTARDGRSYSGRASMRRATWDGLRQGSRVRVEYLPDDPAENRIVGSRDRVAAYVLIPMGAAFGGIGAFLFFKDLRRIRTALRLSREGVHAEARVTEVAQTNMSINKVRQWILRYEYTDFRGETHQAKSDYLPPEEAAEWKPGDSATVRYDQHHPKSNVFLGRAG